MINPLIELLGHSGMKQIAACCCPGHRLTATMRWQTRSCGWQPPKNQTYLQGQTVREVDRFGNAVPWSAALDRMNRVVGWLEKADR